MIPELGVCDVLWKMHPLQVAEDDSPSEVFSEIGRSLYRATDPDFIVWQFKELCLWENVDPLVLDREPEELLNQASQDKSNEDATDLNMITPFYERDPSFYLGGVRGHNGRAHFLWDQLLG